MTQSSEMPVRLLLGPGPSNAHPDVLRAMSQPLIGHMDPAFLELLDGVQQDLRELFGTQNPFTLPSTSTESNKKTIEIKSMEIDLRYQPR